MHKEKESGKKYIGMIPLTLKDAQNLNMDDSEFSNFEKIKNGDFSLKRKNNKKKIKPRQLSVKRIQYE